MQQVTDNGEVGGGNVTKEVHLVYRRGGIAVLWLIAAAFVGFLAVGDLYVLATIEESRNLDTWTELLLHSTTCAIGIVIFFRQTRMPVAGLSNDSLLLPNLSAGNDLTPIDPADIRTVRFPTASRAEIIDRSGQVTVLSLFGIKTADRELLLQCLKQLKVDSSQSTAAVRA